MTRYYDGLVLMQEQVCNDVYKIRLQLEYFTDIQAGQFAMLRIPHRNDLLLKRPFCITWYNKQMGIIEMVYRVVGKGTASLVSVKVGEILQILLPLGNGFVIGEEQSRVCIVTGGIGLAAVSSVLIKYPHKRFGILAGFKNKQETEIYRALFGNMSEFDNVKFEIMTDDGSEGRKGYPTDALQELLASNDKPDIILACGPHSMLAAIKNMDKHGVPTFVSLEQRMACGIGACLACTHDIDDQKKRVCIDGPVFDICGVAV